MAVEPDFSVLLWLAKGERGWKPSPQNLPLLWDVLQTYLFLSLNSHLNLHHHYASPGSLSGHLNLNVTQAVRNRMTGVQFVSPESLLPYSSFLGLVHHHDCILRHEVGYEHEDLLYR